MNKKLTRRQLTAHFTALASGVILTPALAKTLLATPHQTAGPFYPPGPLAETDTDLTLLEGHSERAAGEVILVRGRVTDTAGRPLAGAQVDIWQANANGRYTHPEDKNPAPLDPNFQGVGIMETDAEGRYGFRTIKPAAYDLNTMGVDGWRAQHIHFKLAHGSAEGLTTQMYFAGDPLLAQDLELREVPEGQRDALITSPVTDEETGLPLHRFDIVLG